jgi:hypothetical protein
MCGKRGGGFMKETILSYKKTIGKTLPKKN